MVHEPAATAMPESGDDGRNCAVVGRWLGSSGKHVRIAAAIGVVIAAGAVSAREAQGAGPTYDVLANSGAAIGQPALEVDAAGNSATLDISLGQSGDTPVDVTLAGTGLTFAPNEVTVPAVGRRVTVSITASDGVDSVENVQVRATDANGSVPLFVVTIHREIGLVIEAPGTDGIKEPSWPVTSFTSVVRFRSSATEEQAVRVHFDPLVLGDISVDLSVQRSGVVIPNESNILVGPSEALVLDLSADLVQAGTYTSRLQLRTGADLTDVLTIPISVTRSNVALSVAVDATGTERVNEGGEARIRIDGRETTGRAITIAGFDLAVPRFDDGGDAQDREDLDLAVAQGDREVTGGVDLEPNAPFTFIATVTGLSDSGTYTASVRMRDATGAFVDVPVTIEVKAPWDNAARSVALGVAIAALIAFLGGAVLTWLQRRAKAMAIARAVNDTIDRYKPVPAELDDLGRRMTHRLRDAADSLLRFLPRSDAQKTIKVSEQHLELLAMLVGAWHVLGSTPADPAQNKAVIDAKKVIIEMTDKQEAVDAAVAGLRAEIEKGRKRSFLTAVDQLKKQVDKVRAQVPIAAGLADIKLAEAAAPTMTPDERQAKVASAEATVVVALLDRIGEKASVGPDTKKAYTDARGALDLGVPRTFADVRAVEKAVSDALRAKLTKVVTDKSDPKNVADIAVRHEAEAMGRRLIASLELEATDPDKALQELLAVATWAKSKGATMGGKPVPTDFDVVAPPASPTVAADEADLDPEERWRPNPHGAIAATYGLRALLWVVVGAATIALGVFALWQNDPNWGSDNDIGVAVLWGLGISASGVTGAAGASTVRKSFNLGGGA